MKYNDKTEKQITENKNSKIYIGYYTRLFLLLSLFVILFVTGILFLTKSLNFNEQVSIDYSEKSNLDYKVYLKKNEYYETPYLEKDMLYIASLIDKINIDFNYNFNTSHNVNLGFDYKIVGKLVIANAQGDNIYFEKNYTLLDDQNKEESDQKTWNIKETIDIDYDYYNSLANNFKMSYGLDTTSNLIVYFMINKNNSNGDLITNKDSVMSVTIPLSEKSVNIKMDYNEINNNSNIISKSNVMVENIIYIIVSIILILISIIIFIKLIRYLTLIKTNKSTYDKYINRLLTEYDRLIVETSTSPFMNNDNIVKINKFEELLDVRDNLKLPIMYYSVTKHQKCYFYIKHNEDMYLLTIKSVDLVKTK